MVSNHSLDCILDDDNDVFFFFFIAFGNIEHFGQPCDDVDCHHTKICSATKKLSRMDSNQSLDCILDDDMMILFLLSLET